MKSIKAESANPHGTAPALYGGNGILLDKKITE